MSDRTRMSYSEMLHNFMENDLSVNKEETLFHALAQDEDLRFEMKYLLNLKAAVDEDDEAAVVPLQTTSNLFARLGYGIPATVATEGAIVGGGLSGLFRGWGGNVMSGVIGILLASTFFLVADYSGVEAGPNGLAFSTEKSTEQSTPLAVDSRSNNGTESSLESRNKRERSTESTRSRTTTRTTAATPVTTPENVEARTNARPIESTSTLDNTLASTPSLTNVNDEQSAIVNPAALASLSATSDATLRQGVLPEVDLALSERSDTRQEIDPDALTLPKQESRYQGGDISLSMRGSMVPVALKEPELLTLGDNQPLGVPNDFSVGLEYSISSDLTFLVEGGRESYLMTFSDTRPNGVTTLHEVEPSVLWGTAGIRWSPLNDWVVAPFGQISVGGSGSGFMERMMLGTSWNPGGPLELAGGVELSMIQYQFKGDFYSSPRLGLSYGVRWNLSE